MKLISVKHILPCLGLLLLLNAEAKAQNTESVALKTIKTIGNVPVVYQNEIRGGAHQIAGTPWIAGTAADDDVEIIKERLYKGMLATNIDDRTTYRYTSTDYTDAENKEANWERVFLVTAYDSSKAYALGEIVIDGNVLYKAAQVITSGMSDVISSTAYWTPLAEQFRINNSESGGTYKASSNGITEHSTGTYISGGTEVIFVNEDYELEAAAADNKGATVTIKNTKNVAAGSTATNPNSIAITVASSGTIDGASSLNLFETYDYVTLISDGINWYKVGEGRAKITVAAPSTSTTTTAGATDALDAFYFGKPTEDGSFRMIYDIDNATPVLRVQYRASGSWVNKTTIVP